MQPKAISDGQLALDDGEGEFPAPKRRRQGQLEELDDGAVDVLAIQDEVDEENPELDFDALENALEAEILGAELQANIDDLEEPSDGEEQVAIDEEAKETIANDPTQVNHKWGAFTFTMKYNAPTDTFAWQCACPYHRLSRRTGCNKNI